MVYVVLDYLIYVSTTVDVSLVVTHVYYFCSVLFVGFQTRVNLIILYMMV